jgi:hypothetical protein
VGWAPTRRVASAICTAVSADPGFVPTGYVRPLDPSALPPGMVDPEILSYESVSDGTGSGLFSGFAVASTRDLSGAPLLARVGWTRGPCRSDRAELAALVAQLRLAPATGLVRLVSDCLAMLLLLQWAERTSADRVMRHEHRVLLREWRRLLAERQDRVVLG